MSRQTNANARGKQSQVTRNRGPHIKLTIGGKIRNKNGVRKTTTVKSNNRKKRNSSLSDAASTTSGAESESESDIDEESEEADDESDEPEADALSYAAEVPRGAGPSLLNQNFVPHPEPGEWAGFPDMSDDQDPYVVDRSIEKAIFESDDDMVYERVNEVSDSEFGDDQAVLQAQEDFTAELQGGELSATEYGEDMTSHFANQIDGMSAYGFGDGSDDEESTFLPFSSGDETEAHPRHVRFEEQMNFFEQQEVGVPHAFAVLGHSPTMTRALLPSALTDENGDDDDDEKQADEPTEDDYDCT